MMVNVGLNDQVCVVRSLGPQGWGWGTAEESEWGPPCFAPSLSTGHAHEAGTGGHPRTSAHSRPARGPKGAAFPQVLEPPLSWVTPPRTLRAVVASTDLGRDIHPGDWKVLLRNFRAKSDH